MSGQWFPGLPRSLQIKEEDFFIFVIQSQIYSRQTEHTEAFPRTYRSSFQGASGGRVPHKRSDKAETAQDSLQSLELCKSLIFHFFSIEIFFHTRHLISRLNKMIPSKH